MLKLPANRGGKPKENLRVEKSLGDLLVAEHQMKNQRSSSVADYSLSPRKL